ncbi:hypothetical protein [Thalassospira mesophila]|uniref:Uncharacterized protein n=1 Tax=Thalassospira mesophila TaxID=1293891 RepID=A0A1Y2KZU7_9PROT|nr:hypothetical protein [Thalassospira mesophila]OSQ38365.1 hypothetical protein TMES_10900 [Thalassospira mesophila]
MSAINTNTIAATPTASSSSAIASASANVAMTAKNFEFGEEIYSDPAMRPYLEQYYNKSYAPMRDRIAAMREQPPATITTKDGTAAQELSPDQYEKMIPSFDKWLEMQQQLSAYDFNDQSAQMLEHAKQSVETLENRAPDSPSDIRVVFSNGNQILGYIDKNGGVASHSGASALHAVSNKANELGLTGQARADYILREGSKALSRQYPNLEVSQYTNQTAPTRREVSQTWYPGHDIDQDYATALSEARNHLSQQQATHDRVQSNMRDMESYLLGLMEQSPA